jgi:hypothetical protein
VNLGARSLEPAAAAGREGHGLCDLPQAKNAAIKTACVVFATRRHGELNVIEADDDNRVLRRRALGIRHAKLLDGSWRADPIE